MNFEKYLISSEPHDIAKEFEMSKEKGLKGMEWFKDGTHKIYKFPNGIRVSLIHFPNQLEVFGWEYEIMTGDEIVRPRNEDEINSILEDLFNKTKAP